MKLENAVALVTGANGGIGGHWIEKLENSGVSKIYACARNPQKLESIVKTNPQKIVAIELDITDEDSIAKAAEQCGDVTLLINNAGILFSQGLIAAKDLSAARTEIEINYLGTLAMCRAFAPILKINGGGAIVNMLTMLAKVNLPANGSYCAAKAATFSMTQGVRAELANQGTLVVGVMPGTVDAGMSKDYPPPKVAPAEVVREALQAVVDGVEDVYPGEQAKQLAAQFLSDPKALEKALAQMLPVG
jgi:NAD(P)-dependent dehydrogenase (short-subunit alcohol dehydrogenase family)